MTPRPYQQRAIDHIVAWLTSAGPGARRCYASPTGTGKSVVILGAKARVGESCVVVTPRLEIAAGMLQKLGTPAPTGVEALAEAAAAVGIWTPLRLRNALLAGGKAPDYLILDEGHHDLASTWQDIHALCGMCPAVALTATPFRGTPSGTLAFRATWGEPIWIVTAPEAAALGHYAMPSCRTVPMVDDDLIEIVNGELSATQVGDATALRMAELVDLCSTFCHDGQWSRPTMISMPSRETAIDIADRLNRAGRFATCVLGTSSQSFRQEAFASCVAGRSALVQVNVVSEGVDLPIRRLIDAAPIVSPVKWLQMFGRVTRPSAEPPEYVCTNRNLLRHGYLLDGLLPSVAMRDAQKAFGGPGKRAAGRAVGLEALGRLKAAELPLKSGVTALCYCFAAPRAGAALEYCVIVHPCREEPLWATRHVKKDGETYTNGRWQRLDAPPADLAGFTSKQPATLTEKQEAWWKRSAGAFGLDPNAEVNRKSFQALPVLCDLRARL